MTIGVAKAAGVPSVIECTPLRYGASPNPAILYSTFLTSANRVFALGGVQALAVMAFGMLDEAPVDMLVGADNAWGTEAKRQLFGKVGIDLLAGPSEVAIVAAANANPGIGRRRPARSSRAWSKLTISSNHYFPRARWGGNQSDSSQLTNLDTANIAGPAWRDNGLV